MQVMPVVATLQERFREAQISVRSALPPERFAGEVSRFGEFRTLGDAAPDFHPRMKNSYAVDVSATVAACRNAHNSFERLVADQQRFIRDEKFDLVIADISPLPLAAAQRLGLSNVALCSLDWAATLDFIPELAPQLRDVTALLRDIYGKCDLFLRPRPHIGCEGMPNCHSIGHIARVGTNARAQIDAVHGIDPAVRLVMISSGGMDGFPFAMDIPRRDGLFWILPDWLCSPGDDRLPISAFQEWPFADLVASLDVLVAKPGYGLIVEAVTNGVPFASLERNDWVDVASIEAWGATHGAFRSIRAEAIRTGEWARDVERLAYAAHAPRFAPTGATEAVDLIARTLRLG